MDELPIRPNVQAAPQDGLNAAGLASDRPMDWRLGLPTLQGTLLTLREPHRDDAMSMLAALACRDVSRFISPPPPSVEGFAKFIAWTQRQRRAGRLITFAVVPRAFETAVGVLQLRSLAPDFGIAEGGFALGADYWGSGMFADGARLAIDFALQVVGTRRLEARAVLQNGRGNGALRKLGAVQEGVLRRSFVRDGKHFDQALWALLADEWPAKARLGFRIVHQLDLTRRAS